MYSTKRVYLSLGSNLGDRYAMLQKAVFHLQKSAGTIVAVSPIYENPALGFKGSDFLNACVALDTTLSPVALLKVILQIEKALGRKRSSQPGYQSRTLDIDLIFYENEVIHTPELVIPHIQMHCRNFVLKPLADIAPQVYHPLLNKDTRNLLQQCQDRSPLKKCKTRLFKNRTAFFSQFQYIAIEGNIGAGKTTLAQKMARDFDAIPVLERATESPLLPKFYSDPSQYAFPLELSFLVDRYRQFTEDMTSYHHSKRLIIGDYDLSKSLIFAKITLPTEAFKLYSQVFDLMHKNAKKPGLYLYLHQNTERLLEQIKMRGRPYEQSIDAAYLEAVHKGYMGFIKTHFPENSRSIDLSGLDFVNRASDYEKVLEQLEEYTLALMW